MWLLVMVILCYVGGAVRGFEDEMSPRLVLNDYQVYPHDLAFSPDGQLLAITDGHRPVRLWDTTNGAERLALNPKGAGDSVYRVLFSPDGKIIALASWSGTVRLLEVATQQEIATFGGRQNHLKHITMAFSPDGKTFAVIPLSTGAKPKEREVLLWDRNRRTVRAKLPPYGMDPFCIAFSPDGKTLAVSTIRTDIYLRNVETGEIRGTLKSDSKEGFYWQIAFSADGETLAAASSEATVKLWDVKTMTVRRVLQGQGIMHHRITPIAFSPDGRTLAAVNKNGRLQLWESVSGKQRIKEDRLYVGEKTFAFSPDGRTIALIGSVDRIELWDVIGVKADPPDTAKLDQFWSVLESEDSIRAYAVIRILIATPLHSVPYLRKRLQPSTREIERRLADLDSDDFATRQKAGEQLEKYGELAVPAIRRALSGNVSLDFRKRAKAILESIEGETTAKHLPYIRAVEVLEHIGTAEARKLLEEVAKGAPASRLTREAKASLARLAKRPTPKP